MQIRLTRIRTILLRILLLPVVATVRLLRLARILRRRQQPVYASALGHDPRTHVGNNPILIAVWAEWAHVWNVATRGIVEQLAQEFAGRCEFAYVDATNRSVRVTYGTPVVPTLILRHRGAELERFVNVLKPDAVRSAITAAIANPVPTSAGETLSRPSSSPFTA